MTVEDSSILPSSIKMTMVEAPSGAPSGDPDRVKDVLRSKSTQELLSIARRPDVPDDGFDVVVEVLRDRWSGVVASGVVDENLLRQEVEHVVTNSTTVGEASGNLRRQANEVEQEARNDPRYTPDNYGMVAVAVLTVRETISATQAVAGGRIDDDSVRRMDRSARVAQALGMGEIDFSLVGFAQSRQVNEAESSHPPSSFPEQRGPDRRVGDLSQFVDTVRKSMVTDPKQFFTFQPHWFIELDDEHKDATLAAMSFNLVAAVKRQVGMKDLASVIGLDVKIKPEEIQSLWNLLPTWRIGLATMVDELLELDSKTNTLVFKRDAISKLKDSRYESGLVTKLEGYLDRNPGVLKQTGSSTDGGYNLTHRQAAQLGISLAGSFLVATDAFESADTERKLSKESTWWYAEQVRAAMMPGIKGVYGKWGAKAEAVGTAEAWGGMWGDYLRDRVEAEGNQFSARLRRGEINYFPNRLMYSQLDLVSFENGPFKGRSIAQVLVDGHKTKIGNGLIDFTPDFVSSVDFNDLGTDDFRGGPMDTWDSVAKIIEVLTLKNGEKPKITEVAVCDALTKIRKDALLRPNLTGMKGLDLVRACQASFLGGPVLGIPSNEGILTNGFMNGAGQYDAEVTRVLSVTRWYEGLPHGSMEGNFDFFNAFNMNTRQGVEASFRDEASRNILGVRNGRRVKMIETAGRDVATRAARQG